jgi:His-Xaa-Ser system radical SAM maturase HxsB
VLLVNEVGEHTILGRAAFDRFLRKELTPDETAYSDLKAKHFLMDAESSIAPRLLATQLRTKKAFLAGFTRLHIFVVTLRCEHSCHYCQVSRVTRDRERFDMSPATARKALDLVFRSPAKELKIEFQGGEPLLNFELIRLITEEAEARAAARDRKITFVIATNLALLDDRVLEFCREHRVFLSISLDGPADLHNSNRPRPGNDSHDRTVDGLARARSVLGNEAVSAIMTTTRRSLDCPLEIVDEYVRLGFRSIFLRPISPYGFALRTARHTGYPTTEFLRFYVRALDHILKINAEGTHFIEVYAQILLTRLLTPFSTGYMDLQSPSGAVIGVAVYNYDGDVYATDESRMLAEMGDKQFRLGNVHHDPYEDMFLGPLARDLVRSSISESLPGCSDCVFQPICGADPILNYATQGDLVGHKPTSEFHERNFFLIRHLLELYHSSHSARRILSSWVNQFDPAMTPSAKD